MGYIRFAEQATDDEIRQAVVAWSELLAQDRYAEALDMFPTVAGFDFEWTPANLQDWISNYGCAREDFDSGEHRRLTSIFDQPDPAAYIRDAIDVDRQNLYGLDPKRYLGMVPTRMFPWTARRAI